MNDTPSATAILAPIWRRKWLILAVGIFVAVATYFYFRREPNVFQSKTTLYLTGGGEEGLEKSQSIKNSTAAQSAPEIINSVITAQARRQLRREHRRVAKLAAKGKSKAKEGEKPQFVTITTEARAAAASALLANTIADGYITRERTEHERAVYNALRVAKEQLVRLETPDVSAITTKASKGSSAITSQSNLIRAAQVSSRIAQLETEESTETVQQLNPALPRGAELLGPTPKKNAEFGFIVGIVLASMAAFTLGRLDRRLRALGDVERTLHAQILSPLPQVRRPVVDRGGYPSPSKFLIEPLRRLHQTLQLNSATPEERPRSILFLSADPGDGRSTIVADLALVQREAAERTAIVEADFRRPSMARMLGLPVHGGLAEVLVGSLALEEALQPVPEMAPELAPQPWAGGEQETALAPPEQGAVAVLAGSLAANPPALLARKSMRSLLDSLKERFDHVLIDAPSPLEFTDAMPLLAAVDAIVLVARLEHTHERAAERLRQLLAATPSAPVLGVVANGVKQREMERYGIFFGVRRQEWLSRLIGR